MLSKDKKDLLFNSEKILERHERSPKEINLYKSIILNLYKDYRIMTGFKSTPRLEELRGALSDFNFDVIISLILN